MSILARVPFTIIEHQNKTSFPMPGREGFEYRDKSTGLSYLFLNGDYVPYGGGLPVSDDDGILYGSEFLPGISSTSDNPSFAGNLKDRQEYLISIAGQDIFTLNVCNTTGIVFVFLDGMYTSEWQVIDANTIKLNVPIPAGVRVDVRELYILTKPVQPLLKLFGGDLTMPVANYPDGNLFGGDLSMTLAHYPDGKIFGESLQTL